MGHFVDIFYVSMFIFNIFKMFDCNSLYYICILFLMFSLAIYGLLQNLGLIL